MATDYAAPEHAPSGPRAPRYADGMWLIVALLVIWVVLALLGLAIDAIKWLLWIAIVLIVVTLAFGALMRFLRGQSRRS
jgi:lipopolysaccharide export LptBFGC system permease protein LptF